MQPASGAAPQACASTAASSSATPASTPNLSLNAGSTPAEECDRPRAFLNLGTSCYINATVMALFGVHPIRLALRDIWDSTPDFLRRTLQQVNQSPAAERTRPRETDYAACSNDVRLASVFHVCLQPPRATALVPRLFTDRYYRGTQEDAEEFLRQALVQEAPTPSSAVRCATSTRLTTLCRGRQEYRLRCAACGHFREGHEAQTFTILQLPLTTADGTQRFATVQEALDGYLAPEQLGADFHFRCERCNATQPPQRHTQLAQRPRVLVLAMKRWIAAGDRGVLLHEVRPDGEVRIHGCVYSLSSFVCHHGPSVRHGHYTACIRYATPSAEWWYYDDARTKAATSEQLRTSEREKLYVAFYEMSSH